MAMPGDGPDQVGRDQVGRDRVGRDRVGRDRTLLHVAETRARKQLVVVVLIGIAGAGLLIVVTARAVQDGATAALFLLPAVYLLPLAFGIMVHTRMRAHRPEWMGSPIRVNGLDRPTRRRVMQAVRHGHLPSEPYEQELAREFAEATLRTRWLYWMFAVMGVVFMFDGLLAETAVARILLLLGAALSAVGAGFGLLLVRGARATLV